MDTTSPQGGSSEMLELRIVILRNEDKDNVVKSLLNCEDLTQEKVGLCALYKSERAGRRIRFVEAPGWDRLSITDQIKEEVVRSVSLCSPGPHTLLLVIPVKTLSEEPSTDEINAAKAHMKLLSERVWKHTIVLFACDEGVEQTTIKEHIHSAEKILEKCGGRSHVLQKSSSEYPTQISGLFQKIDDLVKKNRGEVFIPQAYYEMIQKKTQEVSGATELRQRRDSADNPPNMKKDKGDSEEKKETAEVAKRSEDTSKITMDYKQCVLILMGVIGALLGSVAGAGNGVWGSFIGIVIGLFAGVLVSIFILYIYTRFNSKQITQSTKATES